MKRFRLKRSKIVVFTAMLCASVLISGGCSLKKDNAKKDTDKKEITGVTLGEYKTISLDTKEINEQVQTQIDQTLNTYADYKKVMKGKVKKGDTVNIYYVGRVDGKKFDGGSCTKEDTPGGYNLTIGSGQFIEGFEDGLIGSKPGDTVKVKATFPKEYSQSPDLAGKKAVFTVDINYIQGEAVLPKLTDEFVVQNLSSYKSADEYKDTLRTRTIEDLAWNAVFTSSKVEEYPEEEVDKTYNQLYTSINYYLAQNSFTLDDYIEQQRTTKEDFEKTLRETAQNDVGKQLVYESIAKNEKLEVTDEEYQESLKDYLANYGCEDEAGLDEIFESYYGTKAKDVITDDMLFKKVKDYLVDNVTEK